MKIKMIVKILGKDDQVRTLEYILDAKDVVYILQRGCFKDIQVDEIIDEFLVRKALISACYDSILSIDFEVMKYD
jgi:hypothetical protein